MIESNDNINNENNFQVNIDDNNNFNNNDNNYGNNYDNNNIIIDTLSEPTEKTHVSLVCKDIEEHDKLQC